MNIKQIQYQKKIPIKYNVDIAVFGGGIAGIGAACTAAKKGHSVLLVERLGWLGGNGTSGGVRGFCGETSRQGEIFQEIIDHLKEFNAIEPHFFARNVFFKGRKYYFSFFKIYC